ncbi:MAG TPA: zf-HC2 domain-containing protein [Ktedonobacterales bacterium]
MVQARPSADCMRIRRLLAAYRRDDWSPDDLAALTRHLSNCADCRQIEASFRGVGESIRQLPSIIPPPAFREAVFEAIRAEQRRVAPTVAQLSRASTNPSMRAIRPAQHSIRSRRLNRAGIGPRTIVAAAAVLVISLLTARLLPLLSSSSLGQVASSLGKSGTLNLDNTLRHKPVSYPLDSHYAVATSALATAGWLVYSASDVSRASMLFAENRQTKRSTPLLGASTQTPLTVHALTNRWVVWSTGDGASDAPWALYASGLSASDGPAAAPVLLIDSTSQGADTPVTLGGVWAHDDMVLISGATARGDGVLLRIALSSGSPVASVIARTAPGHLPTNPSSDNGTYYWGDVWFDGKSGLHGAIWRGDDAGHDEEISVDESSFHPIATGGELIWVQVPQASLLHTLDTSQNPSFDADMQLINELNGAVLARDLHTSRQWQVADGADVATLQAGGSLLLWHDSAQTHLYDLTVRQTADIAQQVQTAAFAAATDSAVVWAQTQADTLYVSSTH